MVRDGASPRGSASVGQGLVFGELWSRTKMAWALGPPGRRNPRWDLIWGGVPPAAPQPSPSPPTAGSGEADRVQPEAGAPSGGAGEAPRGAARRPPQGAVAARGARCCLVCSLQCPPGRALPRHALQHPVQARAAHRWVLIFPTQTHPHSSGLLTP